MKKDELIIPRRIWHHSPVSEVIIPFEIIRNETYGALIYKPTRKKGKKGYEFMLIKVRGN